LPQIRLVRRRIRSVQSVSKITRAMEMVAASKMRRAQERGLQGRPYDVKLHQVLADLAAVPVPPEEPLHPLLQQRPVGRVGVVHITPDRGLCGPLNANVNRHLAGFILEAGVPVTVTSIGRKGRDFLVRTGQNLRAEFTGLGDRPPLVDILPVARIVSDDFTQGLVDRVYISYPLFVSTLVQRPTMEPLLPVEPAKLPPAQKVDYIFEPDPRYVLSQLLPRYVEMQIYHALLETIASEQSARMVAMRAATENAQELIEHLTLLYNKARQNMITEELLDMVGTKFALEE
jgi:F-type H+-transporting ATPase subunit gamma